jgi:DNA-binding IclR family transcriptional regulator
MESSILEKHKTSTLQRTMMILDCLAERGTASASQLIEHSGIPKSTAYLLLKELQQLGVISQDAMGDYRLWIRLIALGERAAGQLDIREISRPHLERLMAETGLLCHLGILDGDSAYYILKIESQGSISVRSYVGKRLSLYRSGVGKCLLAWQPEAVREAIIANTAFERVTSTTIGSPEELDCALALIRQQGWGFDNGEDESDVRCVAAPVFDARGGVAGAISVVGASMQIMGDVVPALAERVVACACDISKDLGWTGRQSSHG